MFRQELLQAFSRTMGCSGGELLIESRTLEPRRIARLRVPQLEAYFSYSELELAHREAIQGHFDRAT